MTEDSNSTSLVRLNVGGKKFCTYMDTLTQREPNSLLGAMFSGRNFLCQDEKGYVFIDRNGEYFGYILDWLRDNDVPTLEDVKYSQLLKEAQYFQLQGLIDGIHVVLDNKKEKKLGADLTRTDIIKYRLYHDPTHESLKFQGVNLSGLDLSGLNLSNMDFSYACMRNVCFSNANLSESNFDYVDAQGANFNKANLKDSSFLGANLQGASAVGAEFNRLSIPFHGAAHEPDPMDQVAWNRWHKDREINFQTSLQIRNKTLRRPEELALISSFKAMAKPFDSSSVIRLNVGGKEFCTYMDTLTQREPDSMLASMFSGRYTLCQDDKGYVFIDRNGEYFGYILDWLRDGDVLTLEDSKYSRLLKEAQYFQLQGLIDGIQAVLNNKNEQQLGADLSRTDIIKFSQYEKSYMKLWPDYDHRLKFQGVNLSGLDLSGLDLSKINFSYACMKNVCFSNANLSYSCFHYVDAQGAKFDGANLQGSSFIGVNLRGASTMGCRLTFSHFKVRLMDLSSSCIEWM